MAGIASSYLMRSWREGKYDNVKPIPALHSCIFLCEDESGEKSGEYVVKLKAGMVTGVNSLAADLIASQLVNFLDIPTPEPAII